MLRIILVAVVLALQLTTGSAYADSTDSVGSIYAAASNHNVSPSSMLRTAFCESRFDSYARGDHGSSLGLFQLSTLPTGLYNHFVYVGYDDPFDAEQAADYYARVLSGEFLPNGLNPAPIRFGIVGPGRWSCNN